MIKKFCTKNVNVAIAFVLYSDAKHSDILRESTHIRCYLFVHVSNSELSF